jgi:Tfp pilus assembly protein PilO
MKSTALQDRRFWMGGGVVVALILIAASWFLLISPELSSASDTRSQAAATEQQNLTEANANAKLAAEDRNISLLKSKLLGAFYSLPSDSGLPAFTDEVASVSRFAQVGLTGVSVGSITPVVSTVPTPSSTSSSNQSATTDSTTNPAAPGAAAVAGTQYMIPITITSAGAYAHQVAFIKQLQAGPRRLLVTSAQLTIARASRTGSVDKGTTMSSQVTVFTAPMASTQINQLKQILAGH